MTIANRTVPATLIDTVNGLDVREQPNGRVDARSGPRWVGYAFPATAAIVGQPGWIVRRAGTDSQQVADRAAAIALITAPMAEEAS